MQTGERGAGEWVPPQSLVRELQQNRGQLRSDPLKEADTLGLYCLSGDICVHEGLHPGLCDGVRLQALRWTVWDRRARHARRGDVSLRLDRPTQSQNLQSERDGRLCGQSCLERLSIQAGDNWCEFDG